VRASKRQKPEPWAPAQFTFRTVRETTDRLRAVAENEGMTMNSLVAEAVYRHLHRLESRGDPKRRRMLMCGACGKPAIDAATDDTGGTRRARS
jgi:hypothetical protein